MALETNILNEVNHSPQNPPEKGGDQTENNTAPEPAEHTYIASHTTPAIKPWCEQRVTALAPRAKQGANREGWKEGLASPMEKYMEKLRSQAGQNSERMP